MQKLLVTDEVRERPFPATAEEVRAIQDGAQTQLRRPINPQPPAEATSFTPSRALSSNTWIAYGRGRGLRAVDCPYGLPGDRLWIRETWTLGRARLDNEDRNSHARVHKPRKDLVQPVLYRANQLANDSDHLWRQSTHMPRWASRLTLEITAITARRLKDMTISDCEAEGIVSEYDHTCLLDEYERRWNARNAARGFYWDRSLWTWVVTFSQLP